MMSMPDNLALPSRPSNIITASMIDFLLRRNSTRQTAREAAARRGHAEGNFDGRDARGLTCCSEGALTLRRGLFDGSKCPTARSWIAASRNFSGPENRAWQRTLGR